jgi:uncharacterized membrane protein|tara:strand:- start:1737 stop:1931 length:195 start_codon:yes stop_codon:yes gene_type:complete
MKESKKRSFSKTISWRVIAIINSYVVLVSLFTDDPFWNAIIMNVTGAVMYYIHERFWNNIKNIK